MANTSIDAGVLKKCFIAGANQLESNKEYINELNVFPVPDGDTGTNMSMTIMTAAKAVSEAPEGDMKALAKAMSSGSLRGARGNSGVIISQLIRGFCKTIEEHDTIDAQLAAAAFRRGAETAYKAVMKPKEGTILTVAKGMADKITEVAEEGGDLTEILRTVVAYGDEVLQKTPEMLPVLKEAGVVDSGGQGLIVFLKGALAVLEGKEVSTELAGAKPAGAGASAGAAGSRGHISTDDIKFGYCTEFIVNLNEPLPQEKLNEFKAFLEGIGDSIVCVADDDMVKVHVHTNHPGTAFEKGLEIGASLSRMKVDNMREEHEERLIENASKIAAMEKLKEQDGAGEEAKAEEQPRKPVAFISVCSGAGLNEIFKGLGADYIIGGGQTMNPSTDDILQAVDAVHADTVFVLPNNKNIILAAEQAAKINRDVEILVVPTKTIPQGVTALINYTEGLSNEENLQAMSESLSEVKSGELTYAVRNTMIDGTEIKEGNIMGIGDRGILAVGEVLNDTALEMVDKMVDEYTSIVTVYAGEGIDDPSAEMLCDSIREKYPDIDVDCERGDQPVYYYIISVD
ncbi:MAG: DAK2 domain-containing protein [Lachnospiraceae bacterium]|nr:DAK2 domain-containing protein [Lachnospiraceae bacterium]